MKQFLAGIAVALLIVGIAGGSYYLGKNKFGVKPSPSPEARSQDLVASILPESESSLQSGQVDAGVRDNIVAAVKSKNYAALPGYMINPVHVRLEASECCGLIAPVDAALQMDYLNEAINWDFSQANPIVVQLAQAVPDYYGQGAIVGVASNNYAVGFKLNSENKIELISMVVDYQLLLP